MTVIEMSNKLFMEITLKLALKNEVDLKGINEYINLSFNK